MLSLCHTAGRTTETKIGGRESLGPTLQLELWCGISYVIRIFFRGRGASNCRYDQGLIADSAKKKKKVCCFVGDAAHRCIRERNKIIARRAKHMAEYASLVRNRMAETTAAAVSLEAGAGGWSRRQKAHETQLIRYQYSSTKCHSKQGC